MEKQALGDKKETQPYQTMRELLEIIDNNYILRVLTEKPYSKALEHNIVYIPIITLNHATSHDFN